VRRRTPEVALRHTYTPGSLRTAILRRIAAAGVSDEMRILLIESGGFVGIPLTYEVDLQALGAEPVAALERAIQNGLSEPAPPPTSAGGVSVRLERDDGSIGELTVSNAAASAEAGPLVQRLRACARIMPRP